MTTTRAKIIARAFRLCIGLPLVGSLIARMAWEVYWMDPEERREILDDLLEGLKAEVK